MIDSHLSVLNKIFSVQTFHSVLEFGPGIHSTPFFFNKCDDLTCIEMQNESWYEKMKTWLSKESQKYPEKKWEIQKLIGPWEYQRYHFQPWYSLIMIDGHGDSRWDVINNMNLRTNIMVIHDTQEKSYQWDKVKIPLKWVWKDFTENPTWTSVLTSDIDFYHKLTGENKNELH